MRKLRVGIENDCFRGGVSMWIMSDDDSGKSCALPIPLTFSQCTPGQMVEPTFTFDDRDGGDFLHAMANALAEAGYRPDELKAYNKETDALKYHLEDMRTLVFKNGQ